MSNHTPEPWFVVPIAAGNMTIADRPDGEYVRIAQRVRTPNAARIVACVNACRGLDIEKVAALLDAVRALAEKSDGTTIPVPNASETMAAVVTLADSIRAGGGQ